MTRSIAPMPRRLPPPAQGQPSSSRAALREDPGPSAPAAPPLGLLARLAIGVGLLYPAAFLAVALLRLRFPFELEWMEGSMIDHLQRVRAGLPIYVAPSLQFIPFIYPPLYVYAAALLSFPLGIGFLPLRVLSLASTLACLVLIFRTVRPACRSPIPALLAACLFAACYHEGGAWLDVGRVDALCLALLLAGLLALRGRGSSLVSGLVGGALFALAALTKQSSLIVAVPVGAALALTDRPKLAGYVLGLVVLAGGPSWLWDRASGGWYRYYVFQLPRDHPIIGQLLRGFWTDDLLAPLGIALVIGSVHFFAGHAPARTRWLDGAFALGMILSAYLTRIRVGSFINVVVPAYAAASLLFGLGLGALSDLRGTAASVLRRRTERWVAFLCLAQFAVLAYKPWRQVPGRADVEAGRQVVESLRRVPGDVWIPAHPYLAERAGKPGFAHQLAMVDVLRPLNSPEHARLMDEIRTALRERRWGAVVLDGESWLEEEVAPYYELKARMFSEHETDLFWPATGFHTRPDFVWLPKPRGTP